MQSKEQKIGNGSMPLPLKGNKYFTIYGGPYMEKPDGMFGVKMAAEIPHPEVDVDIPTQDFRTPDPTALRLGLIGAVEAVLQGEPVYVGCMGGKGRTGLFLAVMAKAFGVQNPVEYVRGQYYPHAVETQSQYAFVMNFRPGETVEDMIKQARSPLAWRYWFRSELTRKV